MQTRNDLSAAMQEAEDKAWDALSRYKFQMFGYWSAIWVHLNRIGRFNRPNPWRELVQTARHHQQRQKPQPPQQLPNHQATLRSLPGQQDDPPGIP